MTDLFGDDSPCTAVSATECQRRPGSICQCYRPGAHEAHRCAYCRRVFLSADDPRGAQFDGETYEPGPDYLRLSGQLGRVFATMRDGVWRTMAEISVLTGDPEASVSARLRDLRKPKFGGHSVARRPRGEREAGLWEYRLEVNGR